MILVYVTQFEANAYRRQLQWIVAKTTAIGLESQRSAWSSKLMSLRFLKKRF
jgi:hypothetical protein